MKTLENILLFILDPIMDDEHRLSMLRIILLILILWVIYEGDYIIKNRPDLFQYFWQMAVGILSGGIFGKVLQSFSENGINLNNFKKSDNDKPDGGGI